MLPLSRGKGEWAHSKPRIANCLSIQTWQSYRPWDAIKVTTFGSVSFSVMPCPPCRISLNPNISWRKRSREPARLLAAYRNQELVMRCWQLR